jgi:hypothetical protein
MFKTIKKIAANYGNTMMLKWLLDLRKGDSSFKKEPSNRQIPPPTRDRHKTATANSVVNPRKPDLGNAEANQVANNPVVHQEQMRAAPNPNQVVHTSKSLGIEPPYKPTEEEQNDPKWFAYYHHLPCLNPSCKSHGRPHPNCRCYSNKMAKGGVIDHFCATNQKHQKGCEYFQEGGEATADFGNLPAIDESGNTMTNEDIQDEQQDDTEANPPGTDNTSGPNLDKHGNIVPDEEPPQTEASSAPHTDSKGNIIPDHDLNLDEHGNIVPDETDYDTLGQSTAAGLEGVARGVIGPLGTLGELGLSKLGVPGVSAQDIKGREDANPNISTAGELTGLVGGSLADFGMSAAADAAGVAKIGSKIIKNAIQMGIYQTSDEINKALVGTGDPSDAVMPAMLNIGAAMLLGGPFGAAVEGASSGISKGIGKLVGPKDKLEMGTKLQSFLSGFGHESTQALADKSGIPTGEIFEGPFLAKTPKTGNQKAFESGQKTYKNMQKFFMPAATGLGAITGAYDGYRDEGIKGAVTGAMKGGLTAAGIGLGVKTVGNITEDRLIPTMMRVLSNDSGEILPNISKILDYPKSINSGVKKTTELVGNLFKTGAQQCYKDEFDNVKNLDDLKEFIKNGGINQNIDAQQQQYNNPDVPHFAEGGVVGVGPDKPSAPTAPVAPLLPDNDPMTTYFPEHAAMMNASKVRISNYLQSLVPEKYPAHLPFDKKPDQTKQEKTFDKASRLALHPLSILQTVKDGRLNSDDMKHFTSMYPDVHEYLKKKITEKIVDAQMKGEKPPSKSRSSMSLFMGTPLESTLTQPMIAAAQMSFSSDQPPGGPAKSSSQLNKSAVKYQTAGDAAAARASQTE